ncbi:MAG: GxxExxY protein [Gammaproteobacteria bacterium]|nr:GxxExxY protein [Gammaproteobacteria bacterium]
MDEHQLTQQIIGAAIEVHRLLGPGLLESTYQQCLAKELSLMAIPFEQELSIPIKYKGLAVEHAYRADFLIDGRVILELKTVAGLENNHKAQLLTYLRWSGCELGLLLNFNERLLKDGLCRIINR